LKMTREGPLRCEGGEKGDNGGEKKREEHDQCLVWANDSNKKLSKKGARNQ